MCISGALFEAHLGHMSAFCSLKSGLCRQVLVALMLLLEEGGISNRDGGCGMLKKEDITRSSASIINSENLPLFYWYEIIEVPCTS